MPFYVAGKEVLRPERPGELLKIGHPLAKTAPVSVAVARADDVNAALGSAAAASEDLAEMPPHARAGALLKIADGLRTRAEDFARALCAETGKPIRDARVEVQRAEQTFRDGASESTRILGEYLPLGDSPRSEGLRALCKHAPVGPATLITPFNFPLNLAAHKIAPALAAGCPFVLKPDPRTPVATLMLGPLLAEAELPPGSFSILPIVDPDARDLLISDARVRVISFTGSARVGWEIRARAGTKRVVLELGGAAPCVIDAGLDDAALDRAAERLTFGAFSLAGQSCISVQRILVHRSVYAAMSVRLIERASALIPGLPEDEATVLGPLIDEPSAARVESWIRDAVAGGARVLAGGTRRGLLMDATLLENVPASSPLCCEEVFGPVATLEPFDEFEDALERANHGGGGLQAGVFTPRLDRAMRAWDRLETGAVVINDVPTVRAESMPYGGVGRAGLGREGVRHAIREMTELRTLLIRESR